MDSKDKQLLEELKQYDTPTITNVVAAYPDRPKVCLGLYDSWEGNWYTSSDLKCIFPEIGRLAGYAVTVTFGLAEEGDTLTYEDMYTALANSPKPTILCVKQDFPEKYRNKCGVLGGNMMTAFKSLGCIGVISDGPGRDIDEIRPMGMQYMITGASPGHGPFVVKAVGDTVDICDMIVSPGDIVHMDECGAVKFPAEYLERVAELCRSMSASDARKQELFKKTCDPHLMYKIKTGEYKGD